MGKFAVSVALATTVLAGSASARDQAWYIGLEAGGFISEAKNFDLTTPAGVATENALRNTYEPGWEVGGNLGYDFGMFRAEFEVAYKNTNLNEVTVNGVIPVIPHGNENRRAPPSGVYTAADGNARILSFMLNGMFDFGGTDTPWSGFVGGGAGIARTQAHIWQLQKFGLAYADDSDTGFAWQVVAGLRRSLSDKVDLSLKYRFFNVNDLSFQTTNGLDLDGSFRSHSLLLGLSFNLYEDAPAPPPPPPPPAAPPPPPPPPAVVVPGPFLVFFDWDRQEITPEAAAILDRAAEAYVQTGQSSVVIDGHTDTSGPAAYNQKLSERRADAVKAYMAGKGISESQMTTRGFGFNRLLVDTPLGVREPQNRRAEVVFGTPTN